MHYPTSYQTLQQFGDFPKGNKATYNGFGQMVAEKWYDAEETLIAHYKYVYDAEGNIFRCRNRN